MNRTMMAGKIHRATVTDANVDYEGSISVDSSLIRSAGMLPHEQVHVLDIDNGARLETYLIEAPAGSGEVTINGAAAHLVQKGHRVIIVSYAQMSEDEARAHRPKIVLVDARNHSITAPAAPRPAH